MVKKKSENEIEISTYKDIVYVSKRTLILFAYCYS